MSRLALPLVVVLAAGCNIVGHVNRVDPASLSVHIVCAGASAADCPAVAPGAAVCPVSPTPPALGTPLVPVDRSQTFYMFQVQAIGNDGNLYTGYNTAANVYIQFEGSVTGAGTVPRSTGGLPLTTVPMTAGQGCLAMTIPPAFNQTAIWVEDPTTYSEDPNIPGHRIPSGSYAVGSSEPIYRPSPLIPDVAFTTDAIEETSALNNKHVIVNSGTNGAPIVVTSVAPTYFTVTDLGTASNGYQWGSVELYTYSEPYGVQVGSTITNMNGQLSNYLGLPELNFPIWSVVNFAPDPVNAPQPAPHPIQFADIPNTLTAMAPWKSGPVSIKTDANNTWTICSLRAGSSQLASYKKYAEWLVAPPTADCTDWMESLQIVSNISIPEFDPVANQGKTICSLQGILTVVVPIARVNLWTITPRSPADLGAVVNTPADCPP
jgi:hypothetical protein